MEEQQQGEVSVEHPPPSNFHHRFWLHQNPSSCFSIKVVCVVRRDLRVKERLHSLVT